MKTKILNYVFDASAKTITFSDYVSIALENVLIISNVTDGIIIFNFSNSTKTGTSAGNVLTLEYDTTAMDDTDSLLIYYDDPTTTGDTTGLATSAKQLADGHGVSVTNATIEQTTGDTHNDLNIAVAGKDAGGLVQPIPITANGVKVDGSAVTQPVSAASLPLPSGAATAANQVPPASIGSGNKTVTTAGTQVQLASSTACVRVIITALVTNTGVIWVGGSDVAAGSGKPLVPLQDIEIQVDNLADVWIDSTVNGNGVSFLYEVQ